MAEGRVPTKAEQSAMIISYDIDEKTHVDLDPNFAKAYLVKGKSDLVTMAEIIAFINTCKAQKLNPLAQGEVFLVKYSEYAPAQIVVGKAAFTKRAFNNPNYMTNENGIVVLRGDKIAHKEGCCLYPGEKLIGGWCRVHFKRNGFDNESYREVAMAEYNKASDKKPNNWNTMPATMINKVAIVQALRDAFPDDYVGLYCEDELVASGAIPCPPSEMKGAGDKDTVVADTVTQEQTQALLKKAAEAYGKETMQEKFKAKLATYGYEHTKQISKADYDKIMIELEDIAESKKEA